MLGPCCISNTRPKGTFLESLYRMARSLAHSSVMVTCKPGMTMVFEVKSCWAPPGHGRHRGEEPAMTLYDVLLIVGGSWLVFIVVTGVVNDVRRRIEDQRRLGAQNWERR